MDAESDPALEARGASVLETGNPASRPRKLTGRSARAFAVLAAMAMVFMIFTVLVQPARAAPAPDFVPQGSPTAGPGFVATPTTAGTAVAFQDTFERWDGRYLPVASLNLSAGDWPYRVRQDSTSFTLTRLGANLTQARVPGAAYDFRPDEVKETLVLSGPDAAPSDAVSVGLSTSYLLATYGPTAYLLDQKGDAVWQTAPFTAWDSSPSPQVFANPVLAVLRSPTGLVLQLDPKMIVNAQYPLYLDPTWVVKGSTSNGWTGTLDSVTNDRGDANLRLGVLADDFNDNVNEIWTVTSGHSFSLSGGQAVLTATEIHASGSWTNLTLGATLDFASCGASNLMFRYTSSSSEYYLNVNFASQQVTLNKVIAGTTTALSPTLSIPMAANTNYAVKVVAQGNAFQVWWAGVKKWSGTDPSPPGSPLSGNVGLSETTSKCTLYVDNVRARDPARWSGNYTSVARGAASGNVATQVQYHGAADAYNSTDLWINASSDNHTWGGWHLVKSMAAPGVYYPIPDVDQKQYYQVRAVLRSGVDGTPSVSELDVVEGSPPSNVQATTNTGDSPWYLFIDGEVNAVSGNLFLTSTDLSIQAKGEPIVITRTYNSLLASTPGPFGLGTMDEFHGKLTFPPGGNVTVVAADGASYTFVAMGGTAFSPPPGIHDNLIKNGDGTYTLWQPDGSRANFDATGRLTALVDRNGNHRTLTYTGGNPTTIADDSGLSLSLVYDAGNRVTSVTDPMGRTVRYAYDGSGRLTQFADPMGFTENYTYDAFNRITQRVDRAGHVDRFVYDSNGRVSQVWTGEWNYTTGSIRWQVERYALAYASGTQTRITNAAGTVTTLAFNSEGNPVTITGPSVGCALCSRGNSTSYTWDGELDRLTSTDGRGDTSSLAYDWMGNALASSDPGGNTTRQTFLNVQNATQFIGLRTSTATPKSFTTRYTYYPDGNLYATIQPGGNTSYRFYDTAGRLTRLQDLRGNSVTYGYDSHEFRTSSVDAGGNATLYQNDGIGRVWNTTSPGGNVTRSVLDPDGRVTSTTDPMGNTTYNGYDHRGDRTSTTDANGRVTQYVYNLTFGGLKQTTDPGGNRTQYGYNTLGERISMTDANSHMTTYQYDPELRQTNLTTPLGHVTRSVYDAAGNVVTAVEANGSVIHNTYDRSNRLVRIAYPDGTSQATVYDADGNVVERKAFELDDFYVYDNLERVIQTRQVFLDVGLTVWHNYTYDQDGNRINMTGPGGGSYAWDANNRIHSETDGVGDRWSYAYGKDGQLLRETYPDSEYVTYAYDRDGRLVLETSYKPAGSILEQLAYTYDRVGNIVARQTPQTPIGISTWYDSGCCQSFTDNLTVSGLQPSPQTVTVSVSAAGTWLGGQPGIPDTGFVSWYYLLNGVETLLGSQSYTLQGKLVHFGATYSAQISVRNGDVLAGEIYFTSNQGSSETTTSVSLEYVSSTNPTTYVYDREYRLYQATNPDGTFNRYTYDAVGNWATSTAGGSTISYSYNADNELTSASNGYSYGFDANGNRVSQTLGSVTTHYTYDYANDLTPVLTTQAVSSSCTGCLMTSTATLLTLMPSPQSHSISVSGSGILWDSIDYPNCPTVSVTWYFVLNGAWDQVGSQMVTLSPNSRLLACRGSYSGTYTSNPVGFYSSYRVAGNVTIDTLGGVVTTTGTSTSFNAGTFNVEPYVAKKYGPGGLLAAEAVNQGPSTTHYAYDLVGMGGLPQRVAEYTGTTLTTAYFYGIGSDRPLGLITVGASYLYHRDVLDSTTTITDASTNIVASYEYDPYGNLKQVSDTVGNALRFTGLASDTPTGLIYARARYYDPTTGTFLTPDPAGCGRGSTCGCQASSNPYAYAGDDPIGRKDPTGRFANPSHMFDGVGGDINNDLATGVGMYGPRWEIWANPSPNPGATKSATDYLCDAAFGLASVGIGNLVGGGPEDPGSWVTAAIIGVIGGQVCASLDTVLFNEPPSLMKVECGDTADEVCGRVFDANGLGFLGALVCPAFSGALCPMLS